MLHILFSVMDEYGNGGDDIITNYAGLDGMAISMGRLVRYQKAVWGGAFPSW